jgi:acetylornithine deacetylase/succinyl-diaminopimelate desuccinylase-like protein
MSTDLRETIRDSKDKFIEDLFRLLRQPSVSTQNKGVHECASIVKSMMEDVGITTRVCPIEGTFPAIYGELTSPSAKRTLLFYNHYDVQPPEPLELWESNPFTPEIREGKIYARGVSDDKGDLVSRLKAVEVLRKLGVRLPVNLKFIFEGEEEIGSAHFHDFVSSHKDLLRADACIWESGSRDPSGRPEVVLGMKGILYVELSVKTASTDTHSMWAPIVPNSGWRLLRALRTLKDENDRILVKGHYEDAQKPSKDDLAALRSMAFDEKEYRKTWGMNRFVGGARGLAARRNLIFNPTCTVCGLWSGYTIPGGMKTVNPAEAHAKVDFRLVPNQDPDDILGKVRAHLKRHGFGDVQVKKLNAERPAKTDLASPFAKLVAKTAKRVYGQDASLWPLSPGSGPMASFINYLHLPVASIGVGYYDSREHAPNENIVVEDYLLGIEWIAEIIRRFTLE